MYSIYLFSSFRLLSSFSRLLLSISVLVVVITVTTVISTTGVLATENSNSEEIDGLTPDQTTYGPDGYWKPYIEIDGFIWDKAQANANIRLWSPLIQNQDWIVHGTIGGGFFESGGLQGSAGIGFRHFVGNAILGIYGFTDVTYTDKGNYFWRISPGVELLGLNYEARINGYIPIGEDQHFIGNTVVIGSVGGMVGVAEYETNFMGIDGEVGVRLPVEIGEEELHDFWLYGGANYYDHKNTDELYGVDARLEWRINKLAEEYPGSRLSFIANASWNNVDAFDYGGGIRARIPLGKKARCFNRLPQERTIDCPTRNGRMDAAVIRRTRGDQIIVQNEILFDPETDVDMLTVVTVNDGDGSLILGNPPVGGNPLNFIDLTTAANNTSEVLIVVDGDATPAGGYGPAVVDSDTTVLGTGTTIALEGRISTTRYLYTVAGARPQYAFGGNGPVLSLDGSGIHIAGLELSGSNIPANSFNAGIHVRPNSSNIAIEQNVFLDLGGSGVLSDGPTNDVRIFDNNFDNIGIDGISLLDSNLNSEIYGNMISNTLGAGILLDQRNDNALINNNDISNTGLAGISIEDRNDDIIIRNNRVSNTGSHGITFTDNNMDALVSLNTVINSGGAGIIFHDFNDNSRVEFNTINGTAAEGIRFDGPNTNTSIFENDVFNTGGPGINYNSDNNILSIVNNLVQGTGGSGISLGLNNNNITIEGNVIERVGAGAGAGPTDFVNAIRLSDGNGALSTNNSIANNTMTNIRSTIGGVTDRGFRYGISFQNNSLNFNIASNDINGANEAGIRMGANNQNFTIVQNEIDGRDYSLSSQSTRLLPATPILLATPTSGAGIVTVDGIAIDSGLNSNIVIGNQSSVLTSGFSNEVFNVSRYGINIQGSNLANANDGLTIENNQIDNASSGGIIIQRGTRNSQILDNEVRDTAIGIRVSGHNNAARANDNIEINGNQIVNSVRSGISVERNNISISIINNRIDTVFGTNNNNGDALSINRNNSFTEISRNTIIGQINDDIIQIGNNNNFLNSALNISNDAGSATFIASGSSADCVSGAGNIGNITLVSANFGPTITCP